MAAGSFRINTALCTACLVCALLLTPATASADMPAEGTPHAPPTVTADLDDYDTNNEDMVADPLENWNRMWFAVNDVLLLKVIKPVHKGYVAVTPDELRSGVRNFFHNLAFPIRFLNCLLQGKPNEAGVEMGRFIINSTVGMAGFIDVAKKDKPIVEPDKEDFGQTLGAWGAGEGFYIVWPLIGPSTLRDSVGLAGDYLADPFGYMVDGSTEYIAGRGYGEFNKADEVISGYETVTKSAVEPYTSVRNAYIQMRRAKVAR
ncbi:VacJ family lipoprotein [Desulfovibrio oxamicus]|uniref:VacJ family lipoprotein n=1 Tax=Nitratidesulfovibrio oxamicus TaxID=32016 RepID=A0ABS0J3J4_9BACT|nr:VacJ family lipoprotein [Nitratidesulfovibrio oxamicus]MBG3877020.1 VacJ family lipoprotein [Nitratidesulfovibrio oxamicus]